jgi:prostaglandin-endoperoxide synthase 2
MSSQRAGRIGPLNTSDTVLPREISAIEQGRLCNLRSYADYREYAGLPRPRDFSDISTDQQVVKILEKHYRDPKHVEFYVGLFAEDTETNSPLPPLLRRLVAVDAFSQALTNPLLSKTVFGDKANREEAFTKVGLEWIERTSSLRDMLERNDPQGIGDVRISMTREGWKEK